MSKTNKEKELKLMFKYEDIILDIVDNADKFTRGDLQGYLEAQLRLFMKDVKGLVMLDLILD